MLKEKQLFVILKELKKWLTKACDDANLHRLTCDSELAGRLHHEIKDFGCAA